MLYNNPFKHATAAINIPSFGEKKHTLVHNDLMTQM